MAQRTVVIPGPQATSIGESIRFDRIGAGAAGVRIECVFPGDPDGAFLATAAQLTGASQAALVTIQNELIALFQAARGYV